MNSLMTVHTLGPQLIGLLGLPGNCISFELRCSVAEGVTVKCEYHPLEAYGIDTVLAEYELVPRATVPAGVSSPVGELNFATWAGERDVLMQGMSFDAWVCHRSGAAHAAEAIGFDAWMRERTETAHQAMMAHARSGRAEQSKR